MNPSRLTSVLRGMADAGIPQMVVSDPAAIYYLTGTWIHPGERMLALRLSLSGRHALFVNELFSVPENLGVETIWFNDTQDGAELLSRSLDPERTVGVDKNWPARFLLRLMELQPSHRFVNASAVLDRLRMRKDERERVLMREASRLNDLALARVVALLPKGYSERRLAQCVPEIYEELGAEGCAFEPIIAYGPNAAESHHTPDRRLLNAGDCVVIDIGCRKDSYCADMTRTVFYQQASDEARAVYAVVLEAQRRAIAIVRPGVRFCDIDAAARDHIAAAGHGRHFTHRTGHSIGLDVHDDGDVSAVNTDPVQPGMVFSIEPSVKVPGAFGIRIEDLVLVTDDGCEVLNHYDTELRIVS
ncbi:MAG TPA: Xaa-Pro peptidase family protein [Candidatus Methylomirabilis sp.]|nr:Xaa-Pro peptidase family protein [Candidatus Methylomirabilis sp.]